MSTVEIVIVLLSPHVLHYLLELISLAVVAYLVRLRH